MGDAFTACVEQNKAEIQAFEAKYGKRIKTASRDYRWAVATACFGDGKSTPLCSVPSRL
jgi:hypothetical protein